MEHGDVTEIQRSGESSMPSTGPRGAVAFEAHAPRGRRTLGPVADLESHVPAEWWKHLFNRTYLLTDGDVVENDANTRADVELLMRAARLDAGHAILDLCCGQGRHSLALAARGFGRVTGLDASAFLLRLARRRARAQRAGVRFRLGDARQLPFAEGSFDCVAVLGNSFGYFEAADDDRAVIAEIARVLRPGGAIALDLCDGEWTSRNFQPRSWEWIDERSFVCRERALSKDGTRMISREVVTRTTRGVTVDQFYAERLYSRADIGALLGGAGFVDVTHHGELVSESDRNQDLGLMARRLFVSARRPAGGGPR